MVKTIKLTGKKKKALSFFLREFLKSKLKEDIAKIILFGSYAWGVPHKGSDIDILVFAKNRKKVENLISEIAYEALLKYGEDIESIIYSLEDYKKPESALVIKSLIYGQELYSSSDFHLEPGGKIWRSVVGSTKQP